MAALSLPNNAVKCFLKAANRREKERLGWENKNMHCNQKFPEVLRVIRRAENREDCMLQSPFTIHPNYKLLLLILQLQPTII